MKVLRRVNRMQYARRAIAILWMLCAPLASRAQVVPAMSAPMRMAAFGNFTYGYSDWLPKATIYGFTLGGYVQTAHLWGIETRGSLLRWGGEAAQADALVGPRATVHFGRFAPYGAFLGGVGHARWQKDSSSPYDKSGSGGEWKLLGGVDFHWTRRISIRLGEVSYAKVYVLPHGLTPTNYSAGIVFRLR